MLAAADALEAAGAVVAVTLEDAAERRGARSEPRAAAVVLEARQHARRGRVQLHLDRDVADQPRAVLADGLEVDQPDAGQGLVAERVAVAEQLVAAADAEQHRAAGRGGVQRVALDRGEVARAQRLVTVLAAAEVEEVVRVGVDLVAEPGARELEADPAPGAAALEQQQVAAARVDVHQVGIERAHAQGAVSHAASRHWCRRKLPLSVVRNSSGVCPDPINRWLGLLQKAIVLSQARKFDAALQTYQEAQTLEPAKEVPNFSLGYAYGGKGFYNEAAGYYRKSVERLGGYDKYSQPLVYLAATYARIPEKRNEAHTILKQIEAMRSYASPALLAAVYVALNENNKAMELLEQAYIKRDPLLRFIGTGYEYDGLRNDPRFADLLKRIGLVR